MNLFNFTVDGFRITQLIITLIVFTYSMYFAKGYFKETKEGKGSRFYIVTFITLLSVCGIFLSASLFTLFIFFEIMSFCSYFWLLEKKTKTAKKVSGFYLAVSVISGMVMLMGMFMLNNILGTLVISEIKVDNYTTELYVAGALTLVGFCTKAGMYPLHIWLPDTYFEAPAPATAMLSSVLSKAGVFGVILVSANIFIGNENWGKVLLVFSLLTMLWGGLCGVVSTDMKKTVAYSSMSQIGFILFGISMQCILKEENIIAARGTVLHMINHSAFKLILFTLCGIVLMKLKTTKLSEIRGIGRGNIVFAVSFIIAAAGLMGVPFISSGYISKTLLHESVVEQIHLSHDGMYTLFEYLFLFSGGLTVCYMLKIAMVIFAKPKKQVKFKLPVVTNVVLIAVSLFAIVCGTVPNMTIDKIADYTTPMMNAGEMHHTVAYFAWVNLKGAVISIACGLFLYFFVYKSIERMRKSDEIIPEVFQLKNIYTRIIGKDIPLVLGLVCSVLSQEKINYKKTDKKDVLGSVCAFIDTHLIDFMLKFIMKVLELYAVIVARMAETFAELLVAFGFKPLREQDPNDRTPSSYKMGHVVDAFLHTLKIRTSKPVADTFSAFEARSAIRRRMISASLSYGLLFAGIGLVTVLVYMMLS